MAGQFSGFWSYVRKDDTDDGGRLLSLAQRVRAEYRLQTGEDIEIFVDREGLTWGMDWQEGINAAIASTTFFIPIITPSYFRSQSCRQELFKFVLEAQRLGLERLLMPVYWITVPELDGDPTDEAIRLISKYQWTDLRDVRLDDETSATFRRAIATLASELARRTRELASSDSASRATHQDAQIAGPILPPSEGDEPGFLELAVLGEEAQSRLNDIIVNIGKELATVGDLAETATYEMMALGARNASMKERLNVADSFATRLNEPAAVIERLGREYIEVLTKLDPAMHAALDSAQAFEGDENSKAERDEFLKTIQGVAETAEEALRHTESFLVSLRGPVKASRSFRAPVTRIETGLQGMHDGQPIINEWGRRAATIERQAREE